MEGDDGNDEGSSALINQAQTLLDKFMNDPNDAATASDALVKAAVLYEREERAFRNKCSDPFSREREKFPIWE